ncbi:MAG: hypothetical protein M1831_005774 [Alyxoria varia]|nr:MAG: hypothetical protein M1831_005774 [Alyxoria varia]
MPEIAEIARVVHFLKQHLTKQRIASVSVQEDANVFSTSKTGLTASRFAEALKGKTVLDAGQQGKYFWLVMDKPPHPVMHFGMTGWIKFNHDETAYWKPQKEKNAEEKSGKAKNDEEWPPRFWKFILHMESENLEAAFIDARRFARIRLLDVEASKLRETSPLAENGPDPVIDSHVVTREWLATKLASKHVPIKALLLDQAVISGIGNWVADETLYQASQHPEQYSDTFDEEQVTKLYDGMMHVCKTACEVLADSDKFPETWLMKHRWDKGKKDGSKLPNGEKIVHITVGGRTSAIVPSRQKKGGQVAGGDPEANDKKGGGKRSKGGKGKRKGDDEDHDEPKEEDVEEEKEETEEPASKPAKKNNRGSKKRASTNAANDAEDSAAKSGSNKKRRTTKTVEAVESAATGRRRSGRLNK